MADIRVDFERPVCATQHGPRFDGRSSGQIWYVPTGEVIAHLSIDGDRRTIAEWLAVGDAELLRRGLDRKTIRTMRRETGIKS